MQVRESDRPLVPAPPKRLTGSEPVAAGRGNVRWHADTNTWDAEPSYRADVYVFALPTATDHRVFDPLALDKWQFLVAPRASVEATGCKSLSLARVGRIAGPPCRWEELRGAVARAASGRPASGLALSDSTD